MLGPAAYRHVIFPKTSPRPGTACNFAPPALSAAALQEFEQSEEDAFVRWVLDQRGLDSRYYKQEALRRRVPACLRMLRAGSVSNARSAMSRSPQQLTRALSALMIGVTEFFRDRQAFAVLGEHVLPDLTSRGSSVRIWSAGCSDGAELYSVAILLAELGVLHRSYLLGTDCRSDATAKAAAGFFECDAVKSIPRHLLLKYFVYNGSRWRVKPWLRTVVQWRTADALTVQEPGEWDLILCRNLAIYLSAPAAAQLWDRLASTLRSGGVLMVGKAEHAHGAPGLIPMAPCFFRRAVAG